MSFDAPADVIGEVGTVQIDADETDWQDLSFGSPQPDAVVIAKPLSYNGGHPAHVRVKDVSESGASLQVEEWTYLDGYHKTETAGYLVLQQGSHEVGGRAVEVGTVEADHRWADVSFDGSFDEVPVVFTQSQTREGGDPIVTRNRNVTAAGFQTVLQEEEARRSGGHVTETVGYVAVEPGTSGGRGPTFRVGRVGGVDDGWHGIDFGDEYDDEPTFVADMQTTNGGNTAGLRYRNYDGRSVEVRVDEETSADGETHHVDETVGYWVFGARGGIRGDGGLL